VIGAPQLGHFNDATPEGATIDEAEASAALGETDAKLVPHFTQNAASSGFCAPHLGQYKFFHRFLQKQVLLLSLKFS
jgi:hypothetical protein